ncbi:MAG: class I SAM-dependent methyltransferase [Candidatus Pacearchaeota archaeon]|nr:class I SAM-dependent methyltransferase [Candidatus Pacearchaeota archaeon]
MENNHLMENNYLFWDRTAESYEKRHSIPIINYLRNEEEKTILKELKKSYLVADLGSGTGWPSLMLNEKGFDVVAFDYSDSFLQILKNKNKNIMAIKQDCTKDFDKKFYNYFDAVVSCLSFLNYVENWKEAIKNISKISKAKAKVIISIAISEKEGFKKISTHKEKLIIHEFGLREIIKEFENYGFFVKKIKYLFKFIKPRWGDFKKLTLKEKVLLFIEKSLNCYKNKAKIAIIVFERK